MLKTKSGFSLIEVLMALGLISVLGVTSTALLFSQLKTQREIDIKTELESTQSMIRMIISSPNSCKGNFVSTKVNSSPLKIPMSSIKIFDDTGMLKSYEYEKNKKKGNLFINDIYLQIKQKLAANTFQGELVIDAQSFNSQSQTTNSDTLRRKALRIPLKISTDSLNNM